MCAVFYSVSDMTFKVPKASAVTSMRFINPNSNKLDLKAESKDRSPAFNSIISLSKKFPERKDNKAFFSNLALQIAGLKESELEEVRLLICDRRSQKDIYTHTKNSNLIVIIYSHLTPKGQEKLKDLKELEKLVESIRHVKFGWQDEYWKDWEG